MKSNLLATILILLCLGLGVVLWSQNEKYTSQTKHRDLAIQSLSTSVTNLRDDRDKQAISNEFLRITLTTAQLKASNDLALEKAKIADALATLEKSQGVVLSHSNRIVTLETTLLRQTQINSMLQTNLDDTKTKAANDLAAIQSALADARASRDKAQSDAKNSAAAAEAAKKAADEAIAEKDREIAALERKNADLEKQSKDLSDSMAALQDKTDAAQKRLDSADGDQQLLMAELRLIQAQKDELQKKFNDVASLRTQLAAVKENIATARRVEMIERGLYEAIGEKGGQFLVNPPPPASTPTNVSLNVEVRQGGGATIIPPVSTNAPSTNKPTARAPSGR
jgi:chromosome segregation ATPase